MMNKKYLDDICVIRLMLIVLLIIHHAFIPFSGGWPLPDDLENIAIYGFIGKSVKMAMLGSFVMISGVVFGYQKLTKGDKVVSTYSIFKKFRRLILPCIFFSALYIVIFGDLTQSPLLLAYKAVEGAGHLWFLPMLFWCFVFIVLIEKLHINYKIALAISVLLSVLSIIALPMQLSQAAYYFLFFFVGYCIGARIFTFKMQLNLKKVIVWGLVYLIVFILLDEIKDNIAVLEDKYSYNFILKIACLVSDRFMVLVYSSIGVYFIYILANYVVQKKLINVDERIMRIGNYCFGVYIYQQFILKLLYYNLDFMHLVNVAVLPWLGFVITLVVSLILTHFTLKTKVGKFLIG